MNNYFLEKHKQFLSEGLYNGLCHEFSVPNGGDDVPVECREIFDLFKPSWEDKIVMIHEWLDSTYWASEGVMHNSHENSMNYSNLRQTIVLFCHVILNYHE